MRGLTGDINIVEVEGGGAGALVHAHGAELGTARRDVGGHDGVHVRVLHHAGFDHRLGTAVGGLLLGGLEYQLHSAADFITHAAEDLCDAQQHGNVGVMAAGVHITGVLAGEVEAGGLGHGQAVYVGAHGDAAAGQVALDKRDGAGGQRAFHAVYAEALQELDYLLGGAELLVAHLGVAVEIAPPGNHLVVHFVHTASDVHVI